MTETTDPNPTKQEELSRLGRLRQRLFQPVDIASIVVFRMLFGAIMMWEVWRYFENDWIRKYYIVRKVHFKYFGFDWVQSWPGDWMYVHFLAVAVFAFCVMTGLFYRVTSWLLFLSFSYWYLLDETRYLNHLYLTALLAFLLAIIPAHRAKSLDVRRKPELASPTIPAWCLWIVQIQVGIVYFYAGIAKINADWLRGEPLRQWLANRSDYPLIGSWSDTELAVGFFGYCGLLFDLLVVPALLWRRTRVCALLAAIFFNVSNKMMFNIGIFPVLMLGATLLLLPPDWPRKVGLFFFPQKDSKPKPRSYSISPQLKTFTTLLFLAYLSFQLLFPFRHWLYPGNVNWTEEGHRFSWRMKLRQKRAAATFIATIPKTKENWVIDHTEYLSSKQSSMFGRWPDMCIQFAHFMEKELRKEGHEDVEIRVKTMVSLNGREPELLIDPELDLTQVQRTLKHQDWLLPMTKPLLPE